MTRVGLYVATVSAAAVAAVVWTPEALSQGAPPSPPGLGTLRPLNGGPRTGPDGAPNQPSPGAGAAGGMAEAGDGFELKYDGSPIELLLQDYGDTIGRTLLLSPGLPKANVVLRSHQPLTREEYLDAIESVLAMHGLALLPEGDKFIRVVPIKAARQEPMPIRETVGSEPLEEDASLVSQMIQLRHVEVVEAQKVIEPLKHPYGTVQVFERNNSLLVTDTAATINRIMQVVRFIDVAVEARETLHIVPIKFAKAGDIKKKLEEIIAESLEKQKQKASVVPRQRESGQPGAVKTTTSSRLRSVLRARSVRPGSSSPSPSPDTGGAVEEAVERGIIQGDVQMVADERTNILIIITRPENMRLFFDDIIRVLDKPTAPDVTVKVFRLEFADSKDVAGMLNELIGAASKDDEKRASDQAGDAGDDSWEDKAGAALSEFVKRQRARQAAGEQASKVGELSKENVKILADERTNALVIMASEGDMAALTAIVGDMDMMLSQVLIESVIMEVELSDSVSTGIDWVQRAMVGYSGTSEGGDGVIAYAGGGGGGQSDPKSAISLTTADSLSDVGSGLTYYLSFLNLNVDMVIEAAKSDSRSKVISTPVILTTDNTEAMIKSTDRIYVLDSVTYRDSDQGDYNNYSKEDVGLELKVKPRINKNRVVMLEVEQVLSEPSAAAVTDVDQLAGTTIYKERRIQANVAVQSGQTIVLGGQVKEQEDEDGSRIPILGDIPLLGRLFSYNSRLRKRTETVVFLTPYVLDNPDEIFAESRRRKNALTDDGLWKRGWTKSRLAAPADDELIHDEALQDLQPVPEAPTLPNRRPAGDAAPVPE